MATLADTTDLNVREQIVRIDKMIAEISAVQEQIVTAQTSRRKAEVETFKIERDMRFEPWRVYSAAVVSAGALIGATAAVVKLLM